MYVTRKVHQNLATVHLVMTGHISKKQNKMNQLKMKR